MAKSTWPDPKVAAGIAIQWGDYEIIATSVSYSRSAPSEIDSTSMESSILTDKKNTSRRLVFKDIEFGVIDLGEVTCDFFGPGSFSQDLIGMKNALTISGLPEAPTGVQAFLTSLSVQARAGEMINGTCTFRLSKA